MKRKILSLLALAFTFNAVAQKTDPTPYCVSEYNNHYNMLSSISLGAFTHSFGPMGSVSSISTYLYVDTANMPPISTDINSSLLIDFYSTPDQEPAYFGVWIDYNQNNIFEPSEMIMHNHTLLKDKLPNGTASGVALPLTFKAPGSAKPGKTRMRIVRTEKVSDRFGPYDSTFRVDPCYTKTPSGTIFGCTYDFPVMIFSTGDVEEQMLRKQIAIAPNPATNHIRIQNSSTNKILFVTVYDFAGKKLFQGGQELQEINISEYPSGMYFVQLNLENGKVLPYKFLKQ